MKIGTVFEISYAHRIMNHSGKCRNLHGHNGKIEIQVEGVVFPITGMVLDFGLLKDGVRDWVIRHFDHTTILQESDSLVETVDGRLVTLSHPPTAEMLCAIILRDGVIRMLKDQIPEIRKGTVRFWETRDCYAEASTEGEGIGFEWHWDTR